MEADDRTDEVYSKHVFEVVDRTEEVSSRTCFWWIELMKSAQNTVLRLQMEADQNSVLRLQMETDVV
ncbi:chlorohydrolase [Streptococcus pneumoniae]|nr:chlorohydrolase [Streptococcus pneumoniae]